MPEQIFPLRHRWQPKINDISTRPISFAFLAGVGRSDRQRDSTNKTKGRFVKVKTKIAAAIVFLFTLQGISLAQFAYDTLYSAPAGPGVTYTRLYAPSVPYNVSVLEIDLKNPYVRIETVKGGDVLTRLETVSSMASRNSYSGHTVVGAVNGDLYGTVPINVQVEKGEMLLRPSKASTIGFDSTNDVSMSIVAYSGTLLAGDSSYSIDGINEVRKTTELVLYNSYMGASTGTNQYGTEAAVHPLKGWLVNDSVECVVDSVVQGVGNMTIAKGGAVLSGHGTASTFLINNVHVGDTVKVAISLLPSLSKLTEMMGGYPRIVYNGTNYAATGAAQEGAPDPLNPNPRTGIGFSADSSKLFLVTLDGRNAPLTLGMTLDQFADLMIQLGVYNGMNLDGGGSTTMIVQNSVANYIPGERTVSNGILVVSDAPSDGVVHSIRVLPTNPTKNFTPYKMIRVFEGDSVALQTSGFDKYYAPLQIDQSKVGLTVDPRLGRVNSEGYFVAGTQHDSGYVYSTYDSLVDSEFVVVKTLRRISVSPANATTDTERPVLFSAKGFDSDGMEQSLVAQSLEWTVSDTTIGTVDSSGTFKGRLQGTTYVIASYEGLKDSAEVTVQLGRGFEGIDSLQSLSGWSVSMSNVDTLNTRVTVSDSISSVGGKSLRIDYKFKFNGNPAYVYLNRDITLPGVPDSLWIDLRSDYMGEIVAYNITDGIGHQYTLSSKVAKDSTGFTALSARVSSLSSAMVFPITLNQIGVVLAGGSRRYTDSTYAGTIYIDNLRLSYPEEPTGVRQIEGTPGNFKLLQNYPNPFNPTTTIVFNVQGSGFVSLKVYDVLGREVATLVKGRESAGEHTVIFDASKLSSGVYFYRLNAGTYTATRKMLMIK